MIEELDSYEGLELPKAEIYTPDTEIPNVVAGQWVISHGMFGLAGFKQTEGGFLWQVVEVLPRIYKSDYLKAIVRCADEGDTHKLSLSMLYVCPLPPSEKLLTEYRAANQSWLNGVL